MIRRRPDACWRADYWLDDAPEPGVRRASDGFGLTTLAASGCDDSSLAGWCLARATRECDLGRRRFVGWLLHPRATCRKRVTALA